VIGALADDGRQLAFDVELAHDLRIDHGLARAGDGIVILGEDVRHRRSDDLLAAAGALLAQFVEMPEIIASAHEDLAGARHRRLQVGVLQCNASIPPLAALERLDRFARRRHRGLARRQERRHVVGDSFGSRKQRVEMHNRVVDDRANSHDA
jgi:hypothetical protein